MHLQYRRWPKPFTALCTAAHAKWVAEQQDQNRHQETMEVKKQLHDMQSEKAGERLQHARKRAKEALALKSKSWKVSLMNLEDES